MYNVRIRLSVLATLLAAGVAMRLAPYALSLLGLPIDPETTTYPWNFSPILPVCLFAGAAFADRRLSFLLPFATFLLGDLGIWLLTGRADWAFYSSQPVVYLCIALVVAMGFLARNRRTWPRIAVSGLLAATAFFVVTNFGVWALADGSRYPHTLAGLLDCYVQAIPFFRNTLISMAVFLPLLFSPLTLASRAPLRRAAQPG